MSSPYYTPHPDTSYNSYSDHQPYHDPFLNPPQTPGDGATTLSWPRGRDSGITAYDPLSHATNDQGETEAQALATNYRSHTPLSPVESDHTHVNRRASGSGDAQSDLHNRPVSLADNLTYIDEDFNYYKNTPKHGLDQSEAGLVANAANVPDTSTRSFQNMEYEQPQTAKSKFFGRFSDDGGRYPLAQRIEDKKRGVPRQKHPFVVYVLTAVMVAVFIYEMIFNARAQGSPFSFKPVVNPMLGPSQTGLITLGARFPACMKSIAGIPTTIQLGCVENKDNPPTKLCSLETVCGFGGFHGKEPNQWFRFITPIFLHAGLIHILLNMFAQWTLSAQVEREMGSGAFLILYMAAGIFGNVLGGNFSLVGAPSVGASGAIFGTVGVLWVDLFAHWQLQYRPGRKLAFLIVDLVIGVALGYIPGVDNFAHIGGFLMGLITAIILYPVVSTTKRHKAVMWFLRLGMIPVAVILFVTLTRNFYVGDPYAACRWCRYLSCIPSNLNNRCQGTGLSTTTTTGSGTSF